MLTRETLFGTAAWRLDNGRMRVDVLPAFGARIWTLEDRERGVQWVWHNPRLELAPPVPGASYDDAWAGGYDELFPNDAAGPFDGRVLPDHGEWWSREWRAEECEWNGRAAVLLKLDARSVPARCEKLVTIDAERKIVYLGYRVTNTGGEPFQFMLKQHLALAVLPGDRLELPGGRLRPVSLDFSTRLGAEGPFDWPMGRDAQGKPVDISALPPAGRDKEFVYVTNLPEGWAGVRRGDAGLRMRFDRHFFPHCWFFMDLGGWRGLYTVVLEPCTQWPKDMNAAATEGRVHRIMPGDMHGTNVEVELT